ncbi:MAG: ABC transporter ATP-binding protein, partial [Pseudomonadota bacterium]
VVPLVFALVRWQLHRRVLRQSYAYFQDDFAGRIATKVMQAGPSIGDFLTNLIQGIWQFIIFGALSIALFSTLDWRLAVLLVAWFAAYFITLYVTIGEIRERAKVQSQARATVNGRLVDSYTNIQTVKLFAGTDREDAFVREAITDQIEKVTALGRYVTGLRITLNVLSGLLITLTAALGIWLWQSQILTVGALAATLGLVLRLNHMSGWISFQINGLFRELGTIQDTIETVAREATVRDVQAAAVLPPARGPVVFDDVSFSYGRGAAALHGVSLTIPAGQKIGLVGRSGAGKTTLTNALLRLYDLERGAITIDGQDIAAVTQESLRRNIGVVTQDTSLLHRSVYDNILYGRPDATRADVIRAAKQARAHEFITGLSDVRGRSSYDAHVGERGVKL